MFFPDLLRLDSGVTYTRLGQRLFTFCNRTLQDHRRILHAYLSFGTPVGPDDVDRTETLRTLRPTLYQGGARNTGLMGSEHRVNIIPLRNQAGRLVTM